MLERRGTRSASAREPSIASASSGETNVNSRKPAARNFASICSGSNFERNVSPASAARCSIQRSVLGSVNVKASSLPAGKAARHSGKSRRRRPRSSTPARRVRTKTRARTRRSPLLVNRGPTSSFRSRSERRSGLPAPQGRHAPRSSRFRACVAGASTSKTRTPLIQSSSECEGIEARPERDALPNAASDGLPQALLRKGAAQQNVTAQRVEACILQRAGLALEHRSGHLAEQRFRHRIVEDQRFGVHDAVQRPHHADACRGAAYARFDFHFRVTARPATATLDPTTDRSARRDRNTRSLRPAPDRCRVRRPIMPPLESMNGPPRSRSPAFIAAP